MTHAELDSKLYNVVSTRFEHNRSAAANVGPKKCSQHCAALATKGTCYAIRPCMGCVIGDVLVHVKLLDHVCCFGSIGRLWPYEPLAPSLAGLMGHCAHRQKHKHEWGCRRTEFHTFTHTHMLLGIRRRCSARPGCAAARASSECTDGCVAGVTLGMAVGTCVKQHGLHTPTPHAAEYGRSG